MAPLSRHCQKQCMQLMKETACSSKDSSSSSYSSTHSSSSISSGSIRSSRISSSSSGINNSNIGQAFRPQTQSKLIMCKVHCREEDVPVQSRHIEVEGREVADADLV